MSRINPRVEPRPTCTASPKAYGCPAANHSQALRNGTKPAVHADHLNTPRKLTRANSGVTWQWAYSAFGDAPPTLAADRYVNPSTTANAGTTSIPRIEFNLRYPGQVFDKESNLSYNYFRSYRATDGRYTQADPIGLEGGWNRFGYVDANPLLFTDPLGLQTSSDPWFGYGGDKGFKDWWHNEKKYYGGQDIPNKQVCDNLYKDYQESKERGKGGKSGRGGKNKGDPRPNVNDVMRNGGRGGYGRGADD